MGIYVADAAMDDLAAEPNVSRAYAWVVFALTFGLLLSDFMSRQVLNAVFPLLKAEWSLTDTQLGSLAGIVALTVGVLTFPLSLLADRWGRVKSLVLMAALWSLATLGCAIATNYGEMFIARLCVGVGEAAYGSVGIAVVLSVFPRHMRATLSGAFMAGGAFGSVLGMALGGAIAAKLGWRWSFASMAIFGLVLVVIYRIVITERRLHPDQPVVSATRPVRKPMDFRPLLSALFSAPSIICAYIGNGLQLFIMGSLIAWIPSFLNRYYDMATDQASLVGAAFVLVGAVGMIACGIVTDRIARNLPERKWIMAISFSVACAILLFIGFRLEAGNAQLFVIAAGTLLAGGTAGPAGAMVANLTKPAIHATAFATLALANNLFGMAPGPIVTGMLADHMGLLEALRLVPLAGLAAAVVFIFGRRHYAKDLRRVSSLSD
jgi:MFS family permease